jgi:putative sigma-54 modulation protein
MELPIDFTIRSAGTNDPETLRAYARRRLGFTLRRFENRIRRVIVRLADINGPKRGMDSHCSITLQLRDGGAPLAVDAVTTWPFASITLAARRLNAVLRHDLERAQHRVRRGRFPQGQ